MKGTCDAMKWTLYKASTGESWEFDNELDCLKKQLANIGDVITPECRKELEDRIAELEAESSR